MHGNVEFENEVFDKLLDCEESCIAVSTTHAVYQGIFIGGYTKMIEKYA